MLKFKALAVAAVEMTELDCFAVVMAETSTGEGRRLELQRSTSFTEQDRELGEDTYAICNELGACTYGGISSWTLSPGSLRLTLEPDAAGTLDIDEEVIVEFELSPAEAKDLELGLRRVLGDHD